MRACRLEKFARSKLRGSASGISLLATLTLPCLTARAAAPEYIKGYVPHPAGSITFTAQVAPIIFHNCSPCHRPGQSAPFPLLDYSDVERHARTVVDRVTHRAMPPWLPEPGTEEFEGERRLTVEQIGILQQWLAEGWPRGNPADLPPKPVWTNDWELGQPDLVLTVTNPCVVPADGHDAYRLLVVPNPAPENHYVRAFEFHPGSRAVHHAFFLIDPTQGSRIQAARAASTGEGGMDLPESASTPEGHSLSWQPGRRPYLSGQGMAWTLPKGADLVIQLHCKPTGKPEFIRPQIGLYFTDESPTKALLNLPLTSKDIDIPAGATDYTITDSYRLPVPVEVLGVNPHAHYLGKELRGYALLPDGTRKDLIWIKRWDFAWQNDYQFKHPVPLPQGTTLMMRYSYDNSDHNPANPHHPPQRVEYGLETTDEMGELWVQITGKPADLARIRDDFLLRDLHGNLATYRYELRKNPNDATAMAAIGKTKLMLGERPEAMKWLRDAIRTDPSLDEAHYQLGVAYRLENQPAAAREEFQKALELNPHSYKAAGNLGALAAQEGKYEKAERYLRRCLALNPNDPTARELLDEIHAATKNR